MKELRISVLTKKELDVLALWLCGQTAKQSASYLGKSHRTIESHRERIKCKLGIYRSSELRQKAITTHEYSLVLEQGLQLLNKSKELFVREGLCMLNEQYQKSESPHFVIH